MAVVWRVKKNGAILMGREQQKMEKWGRVSDIHVYIYIYV